MLSPSQLLMLNNQMIQNMIEQQSQSIGILGQQIVRGGPA
jgi:hypothetical protein